ncbi:hypothetical protein NQ317_008383 [Molorchus minor]|uniref:E3 ubiquitin-protein ligase HERC1 n=1 Tax=Molorchus minor TaxID=1323400 RepID=A0ABQ9K5S4_9CUCU|nr:hypothetical protein NQ317_008383 [Molorchus minor]
MGQVYSWGSGPILGMGYSDAICLQPMLVGNLAPYRIMDISAGDTHCLALTDEHVVFAWGTNSMGQCGQGHTSSPITKPHRVVGLEGVPIRQISAGTSHSIAWTTTSSDSHHIAKHKPFCLDLHEKTFGCIKTFLEKYTVSFKYDHPPPPFASLEEHARFVLISLKLLRTHLNLCINGNINASILSKHAKALRMALFRLVDIDAPSELHHATKEVLNIGAPLLLPQLSERVEFLHTHLSSGSKLSPGQQMLLGIILNSLEDPVHIASLLGYSNSPEKFQVHDLHLTGTLMHTLLQAYSESTEDLLDSIHKHVSLKNKHKWQPSAAIRTYNLQHLLSSLQNHMLAHYTVSCKSSNDLADDDLLLTHLSHLFGFAIRVLNRASYILSLHPSSLELLYTVLLESVAGAMLFKIFNSLLLVAVGYVKRLYPLVLDVLEPLDRFNQLLPTDLLKDSDRSLSTLNTRIIRVFLKGSETPTLDELTEQSWMWIVDTQKTCSLLIGHCLGVMLIGDPPLMEENLCRHWLQNEIFSSGITNESTEVEALVELSYLATSSMPDPILITLDNLPQEVQTLCKLALNLPCQYDEACAVTLDDPDNPTGFFEKLMEGAELDSWEFEQGDKRVLDIVVRCFFATLLKHTGLSQKADSHSTVNEVFKHVLGLRQRLINLMCSARYKEEEVTMEDDKVEVREDESMIVIDSRRSVNNKERNFQNICQGILQRCLFLLIFVREVEVDISLVSSSTDREPNSEKAYVDFYQASTDTTMYSDLKNVCASCSSFILNELSDKPRTYSNDTDLRNGWCTEPAVLYKALLAQKRRALSRFQGLDQLLFHLVTREPSPTVSYCIQQQLLEGCFGFCNVKNEESCTQLHHYFEDIHSSPLDIQEKIRTVVHGIYDFLTHSLKRQIVSNCDNRQLLSVTIFSLSTRYESNDLTLVISNDLAQLLMQLVNVNGVSNHVMSKSDVLSVASLRLIHILAMSCCINSSKVDLGTLENVINILHQQFIKTMEGFDESCQSLFSSVNNERGAGGFSPVSKDNLVQCHHTKVAGVQEMDICSPRDARHQQYI